MASVNYFDTDREIIIYVNTNECGYVKDNNHFYYEAHPSLIREYRELDKKNGYLTNALKILLISDATGNMVMFEIIRWAIGDDKYYQYESVAEFKPLEIYKNSSHIRSLKFTMVLVE